MAPRPSTTDFQLGKLNLFTRGLALPGEVSSPRAATAAPRALRKQYEEVLTSESTSCPTVTKALLDFCDDTDLVTNKKALVSEGFSDKQVLDLVGCAGKI